MVLALAPVPKLSALVVLESIVNAPAAVRFVEVPRETVPDPACKVKFPAEVPQVAAAAEVIVKAPELVDQVEAAPAVKVKAAPLVDIFKMPAPPPTKSFIVKLLLAKLMEVLASRVIASLNSVKSRESVGGTAAVHFIPEDCPESTIKIQPLVPPTGNLTGVLLAV